jgi:hypothetical protein
MEGLDQDVVRPSSASRLDGRRAVVGSHHEHRDRGQAGLGTELGADGIAVNAGHLDIEQHQIGPDGNGLGERVGAVSGGDDLVAFQPQVNF